MRWKCGSGPIWTMRVLLARSVQGFHPRHRAVDHQHERQPPPAPPFGSWPMNIGWADGITLRIMKGLDDREIAWASAKRDDGRAHPSGPCRRAGKTISGDRALAEPARGLFQPPGGRERRGSPASAAASGAPFRAAPPSAVRAAGLKIDRPPRGSLIRQRGGAESQHVALFGVAHLVVELHHIGDQRGDWSVTFPGRTGSASRARPPGCPRSKGVRPDIMTTRHVVAGGIE